MFVRYLLRTTDLDRGRAFYEAAIGLALPDGMAEASAYEAWPLHEQARARGAPAHWLGQIAVDDVGDTLTQLLGRGARRWARRSARRTGRRSRRCAIRPAPCSVSARPREEDTSRAPMVEPQRVQRGTSCTRATSRPRGRSTPGRSAGRTARPSRPPTWTGGYRLFSWSPDGAIVGGVGNTARRAGVHAHWMFCFPVAELDAAAERVRTLGGTAMAPVALPDGRRVVGCEDPQGAAFGLVERARRTEATASSA